ncbi:hypothetical protein [Actinoallomurus sp. CA-142502]|uniref:hypothetical protein n=1 Tax=Actinoallomurus sp. CA-142502 TaxID=3239885 RepID=UPI003D8A6EA7
MSSVTSDDTIVIEKAGVAAILRSAHAGAAESKYAKLPVDPDRTTVVVDASAANAFHRLDDDLLDELADVVGADAAARRSAAGTWGVRLIASRAGRPGSSGTPALACRLADRLGMGVVAPDGELIVLRGGEVFSAGRGAGWRDFQPGRRPGWSGPRYPAPAWQKELLRVFRPRTSPRPAGARRDDQRSPRVTVDPTPAGLWVRTPEAVSLPLGDHGFGVPVELERPIVVVGAPGESAPAATELAAFLASLSHVIRSLAVVIPYGQDPTSCATFARNLAEQLGAPIRAYHALPYYTSDGTRRFIGFSTAGRPERPDAAGEHVYPPERNRVVTLDELDPASYVVYDDTFYPAPSRRLSRPPVRHRRDELPEPRHTWNL